MSVSPTTTSRSRQSNTAEALAELKRLYGRSTLSQRRFSVMLGLTERQFSRLLTGASPVRPIHLYAAKFALLRLGQFVELDRVPVDISHPKKARS